MDHLAQSVKPPRILASTQQHYRRENVYFQSTYAVVAEETQHVHSVYIVCVDRLRFRNAVSSGEESTNGK